jgi:hypothetical protein
VPLSYELLPDKIGGVRRGESAGVMGHQMKFSLEPSKQALRMHAIMFLKVMVMPSPHPEQKYFQCRYPLSERQDLRNVEAMRMQQS